MIGVNREAQSSSGASLSTFGGAINPGGAVSQGLDPDYIVEFARAHENSGFDQVLLGYSSSTPDGFAVAGYAAHYTRKLGLLDCPPRRFMSPTLAGRMAATLGQLTSGRIALHVITGGSDVEQQREGDWLDHEQRYRRTGEYLEILRRVWTEEQPFDYQGEFYHLRQAHSEVRPWQNPHLRLFFGGASEDAKRVGARHADVFALGESRWPRLNSRSPIFACWRLNLTANPDSASRCGRFWVPPKPTPGLAPRRSCIQCSSRSETR